MSILTRGRPRALKRRKPPGRPEKLTVGQYLLKRLSQIGITHLFLTPDARLKRFSQAIEAHPKINLVSNPSCVSIGEMADGFGKVKGISALATARRGGEMLDILMRSSVESVPLILIFGKTEEDAQIEPEALPPDINASFLEKLFRQHTVSWTELSDPKLAAKKIDRVLDYCLFFKKPVCIELPQEVVDCFIPEHQYLATEFGTSDSDTLEEVLFELEMLFTKAKHPLMYIDRDVIAHKADALLLHFAESWHIPITSSPLAKNFLLEAHSNYCGPLTDELLQQSDLLCVIGMGPSRVFHNDHIVHISSHSVSIDHRHFPQLLLKEVILGLCSLEVTRRHKLWHERKQPHSLREDIVIISRDPILVEQMAPYFTGDVISSDLCSPRYSLACALGVAKAVPQKRPVVLLHESDLRASLSELYLAREERLPLLICVMGSGSWMKDLFSDVPIYRHKIRDAPANELIIIEHAFEKDT